MDAITGLLKLMVLICMVCVALTIVAEHRRARKIEAVLAEIGTRTVTPSPHIHRKLSQI